MALAFVLITVLAFCPIASAQPALLTPGISGNSILITNTGSPGDLQFLIENFLATSLTNKFPNATNGENIIGLAPVDTNSLSRFTVPLQAGYSFFQTRTVVNPSTVAAGTNIIKVVAFPEDMIITNTFGRAGFMVIVEGVGYPLQYQWFKNQSPIAGANARAYSFDATNADNGSTYSCQISIVGDTDPNNFIMLRTAKIGSPDAVLVLGTNAAPSTAVILGDGDDKIRVLSFPKDTIVTNTTNATFTVIAEGIPATNLLQYRWYWNDLPIGLTNLTATSSNLVITNAHFDPGPTSHTSLNPNSSVGFYSCDVNMVGHRPVRVRSAETNSPGARLSVYTGTNTTLYTAYQQSGSSTCIGSYSGYVRFMSSAGNYRFTPPPGMNWCQISDQTSYNPPETNTVWYWNACQDSCSPPLPRPTKTVYWNLCGQPDFFYYFAIYVLTSPFPTGAQFILDVRWFP